MKVLKGILGVGIMLLGLAGLVLPILPGWVLIFAGACLLFPCKKSQKTV